MKSTGQVFGFILFFNCIVGFGQLPVFEGEIGNYPIEVTFVNSDFETGTLFGKYRYKNKESYLQLEGEIYNDVLYLEEYYKGELSGQFYLRKVSNELIGKWIGGGKYYPVVMTLNNEALNMLKYKSLPEQSEEVNGGVRGKYACEEYYINDLFFSEEKPVLDIGFSGGSTSLEQIHSDSLRFLTEVVCGPTYHIAYAQGIAVKKDTNLFECIYNVYEGDTCKINIILGPKSVNIKAYSSTIFVCEFGARAYLDHTFLKIKDEPEFPER